MLAIPGSIIRCRGVLHRDVSCFQNTSNPILTPTADTWTIPATAVLAHIEAPAIRPTNVHGIPTICPTIRVRHFVSVVGVGVQLRLVAGEQLRSWESPPRAAGAGAVAGGFAVGGSKETGEVSAGDGFHRGTAGGNDSDVDFDGRAGEADVVGWVGVGGVGEEGLGEDDDAPDANGGCTVGGAC